MENQEIQTQINDLNKKMDLILDHIHEQNQKREVVEDLVEDLSIVSRDAYKSTVDELEEQQINLDLDEAKLLLYKFMRNIGNISSLIDTFESLNDFIKDATPIANEIGIDMIKKLYLFEQRGYFDYLQELYKVLDEMHKHYSVDNLRELSGNMDLIFRILKNVSNTEMLQRAEKATAKMASMQPEDQDNKSTIGLLRELNKPETRQSLAFSLRLLRTITETNK